MITHLGSGHLKNDPVQPIHVYKNCEASWVEIPLPFAVKRAKKVTISNFWAKYVGFYSETRKT